MFGFMIRITPLSLPPSSPTHPAAPSQAAPKAVASVINSEVLSPLTKVQSLTPLSDIFKAAAENVMQGAKLPLQFSQTHRHVSSGCQSSRQAYDIQTIPSLPAKYGMTDNMVFAFTNDEVFTVSSEVLGEEDIVYEGACVGHTIGFLLNKLKDGHSVEECAPSPEDEGERPGSIALQKNYLVINKNMPDIVDENPNVPPLKASHEQAGLNIDATGHFDDLDSLKVFLHDRPAEGDVAAYSVTAHFADKDDQTVGSSHTFAVVKEGGSHRLFVFDSGIGLMKFQEDDAKQNVPLAGFVNENRDSAYHYDVLKVSANG